MKFVSIGPAPPWRGGIAQYHFALAHALRSAGNEVSVITFRTLYPRLFFPGTDPKDHSDGALEPLGEAVLRPLAPWTWRRAARLADRLAPDALLFQWWHPFFAPTYLGVLDALRSRPRIGFICHNVDPHEGMPFGRWLTARSLRRADFAVTGGEGMAEQLAGIAPDVERTVVGHPAYHLPGEPDPPTRETARERLGFDQHETLFLFFGLVRAYKGLDVLIEAAGLLPPDAPWRVVVAGEFYQERAVYDEQLRILGVSDRVVIHDRFISRQEAPDFFAAADLVVLPYREATQSGVAALAFAQRRPVLTTRVGALPETILEGTNGWLVPPADPGALAERMRAVIEEPASARLPVCEGITGIPTWTDLAGRVAALASGEQRTAS